MMYGLSYLVLLHDNVLFYILYYMKFYSLSLFMSMNEANATIAIITLFGRRNTQRKKAQLRSSYVEVLHQIAVLDIC